MWSRWRLLAGTMAALVLGLSLFAALASLHSQRAYYNELHDSAVELDVAANALSALAWEAMANGDSEEDEFREAGQLIATGDGLVAVVARLDTDGTPEDGGGLTAQWSTYSAGALRMIELVDAGDVERADDLDDELVDPVFEELSQSVQAIRQRAVRLDARADRVQVVGSGALIGAALLALAAATSLAQRRRRVVAVADVLREAQTTLRHQATHDSLTGLPNRALFAEAMARQAKRFEATGIGFAVLVIDLDGFKEVNDTLGHHTGDDLLQAVARRLLEQVRPEDVVARFGGDEFAILLPDVTDESVAERLAQRLLDAMRVPVGASSLAVVVEASIGVALCPRHGTDPEVLMRAADVAMYAAKGRRGTVVVYDEQAHHPHAGPLALLSDLRDALSRDNGELFLAYQPQVDPVTGRVDTVEALLRWVHPVHGLIPPDEFIPAAERTGLIDVITTFVLDRALGQLVVWDRQGLQLSVAVNVSVRNLMDERLPDDVLDVLVRHGITPGRLEVEITETAVMGDRDRAARVLNRLAEFGVRVALDDYGTGSSSLTFLQELPIDVLKIDRRFVAGMGHSSRDRAIVSSTIDLARHLELKVIAEGVESDDELSASTWRRCDAVQGYLFSKPVLARDLPAAVEACAVSASIQPALR